MKKIILLIVAAITANAVFSQFIYKIKADSVLITNDSCNAELNLENSTKNILGFLFNRGNGRTEFRKGVIKINDSTYIIGADTLRTGGGSAGFAVQDGLIKSGSTIYLGNTTSGSGLHNFTANRYQYLNGNFYSIGGTTRNTDSFPVFRFYNNGDFSSGTTNQYHPHSSFKNGIRYNGRLGYLQVGVSDNIDTTVSEIMGPYQTSAILLNSDDPGTISGQLRNSFIGAYNVHLSAGQSIKFSMLAGGSYFLGSTTSLAHVLGGGVYHTINGSVNGSLIIGNSQQVQKADQNSGWFGFFNSNAGGLTYGSISGGFANNFGGVGQLTVGTYLTNKSHAAAAFGNGNVPFTTLPYNGYDSMFVNNTQNIEGRYLLFSLGNSSSKTAVTKSNALSVLYNGRTQINTTGFSNALTETDVTPKAALEVVSTNSGVLLPKLTNTQRNAIAGGDLQNGLLLYNTDSSRFQFYNGSIWQSLQNGSGGSSGSTTDWSITGNAGTNSGTNFLGTIDNISLRIRTNNIQRAVIDSNGKVGINTDIPSYQLDVNGDARVSTIPFVASRDTVLTYDASTKQIKATLPVVSGTLLAIRVLTSGTSYTPTAGTKAILATLIGGGGGGGGVTGAANNTGVGGGGGSGSMLTKYITGVGAGPFTYAIGTAGTGGANTGGTGGTGGSTTLSVNAVTYTAPGGSGGVGQTAGTAAAIILGGTGGAISTNGDVNGTGAPGERGFRLSGTVGSSGNGGSTLYGGGGKSRNNAGAGNPGTGFGAGGGGAQSTAATAQTGGAGSAGVIIIYEYR